MSAPLLAAEQISRRYGAYQALAPVDLELHPGEIVLLSGPNGAGKTTLLLCLSGLIRPTTGHVRLEGFDLYRDEVEARRRLAFVPDVPRFYYELTAWEHLRFISLAHGINEDFAVTAERLLKEFGLWDARDLYPQNYSRGMRLKLGLAMALIRPFRVLLLDEPTSALDVEGVELVRSRLIELREQGAAVLLSSHDPAFARDLSNRGSLRVWRLQHGQLEQAEQSG